MHIGEEKPLSARLNTRRNSTPVQVSTDLRSHMTSHAPFPDVEEETASSDDTGGHVSVCVHVRVSVCVYIYLYISILAVVELH